MLKFPKPQWRATSDVAERNRKIAIVVGIVALLALPVTSAGAVIMALLPPLQCNNALPDNSIVVINNWRVKVLRASYVVDGNGKLVGWIYEDQLDLGRGPYFQSIAHKVPTPIPGRGLTPQGSLPDAAAFLARFGPNAAVKTCLSAFSANPP